MGKKENENKLVYCVGVNMFGIPEYIEHFLYEQPIINGHKVKALRERKYRIEYNRTQSK